MCSSLKNDKSIDIKCLHIHVCIQHCLHLILLEVHPIFVAVASITDLKTNEFCKSSSMVIKSLAKK